MKKLLLSFFLFLYSLVASASVDNAIAMSYATMSIYQNIVLSTAQKAGGTFTLTVQAKDGGGRGPPNYPSDVANLTLKYYNSSGTLLATSVSNNSTTFGESTFRTYTLTSANCGGSCANVYYVQVSFTGNDGGYWAGNMGTNFMSPVLTFTPTGGTAGTNILYNPEFGVYGTATSTSGPQGWWNTTNAWGGNTRPQLINYGATVNTDAGGYFVQGGTLSGQVGGYPEVSTYPSYMTVGSNPGTMTYGTSAAITTDQQTRINSSATRQSSFNGNSIYIDQVGSYNTVTVTQSSPNNQLKGVGQPDSYINGNSNNITVRQGNPTGIATGKNLLEMRVVGDSNTLNLNQGYNQTGTADATDSNNHYQMLNLTGSSNSVIGVQKDTASGTGHFMETTISGNNNTIDLKQSNASGKVMFTNVNGSNNTITADQSGNANHYLETNLVGNGNSVLATQSGNTQNRASINITNAGGPGSVDLQQTGGANYNITTTCVTASGCGTITIRQ